MRRPVGAEQTRLREAAGITAVGLHLASAGGVHRREVRVADDDLVAEALETAGHPLALCGGLDEHPGWGPRSEDGRESLALGPDAPLDDFPGFGEDVDLAFPLVHVDANMVHGWPLLSCGVDRGCSCGAVSATTLSGEASRLHPIFAPAFKTAAAEPAVAD